MFSLSPSLKIGTIRDNLHILGKTPLEIERLNKIEIPLEIWSIINLYILTGIELILQFLFSKLDIICFTSAG